MKSLSQRFELIFCPYENCGRGFVKPLLLTNPSGVVRETYYACPYCQSKLDIRVENLHVTHVGKCEGGESASTPASCPYSFGYLSALQETDPIPDECLTCPKIMRCSIKE